MSSPWSRQPQDPVICLPDQSSQMSDEEFAKRFNTFMQKLCEEYGREPDETLSMAASTVVYNTARVMEAAGVKKESFSRLCRGVVKQVWDD